jgi:hypothetical protein
MSGLVTAYEIPAAGSAEVSVLRNGYVGLGGDDARVGGTVTDRDADGALLSARESA